MVHRRLTTGGCARCGRGARGAWAPSGRGGGAWRGASHRTQLSHCARLHRYVARLRELGIAAGDVEDAHGALQRVLFQPTPALAARLAPLLRRLTAPHVIALHFRTKGHPQYHDPPRLEGSGVRCHLKCATSLAKALQRGPEAPAPVQIFVAADRDAERAATLRAFSGMPEGTVVMQVSLRAPPPSPEGCIRREEGGVSGT